MLFSVFVTRPFCLWKDHNGNAATLVFCVIPAIEPYQVYLDSGREFSFNNINLCEINAVQIYELIFCDSER